MTNPVLWSGTIKTYFGLFSGGGKLCDWSIIHTLNQSHSYYYSYFYNYSYYYYSITNFASDYDWLAEVMWLQF